MQGRTLTGNTCIPAWYSTHTRAQVSRGTRSDPPFCPVQAVSNNPEQPKKTHERRARVTSQAFSQFLEARARDVGHLIGVEFGEGFTVQRPVGVREVGELV